jgi:hypothetical protein
MYTKYPIRQGDLRKCSYSKGESERDTESLFHGNYEIQLGGAYCQIPLNLSREGFLIKFTAAPCLWVALGSILWALKSQ